MMKQLNNVYIYIYIYIHIYTYINATRHISYCKLCEVFTRLAETGLAQDSFKLPHNNLIHLEQ